MCGSINRYDRITLICLFCGDDDAFLIAELLYKQKKNTFKLQFGCDEVSRTFSARALRLCAINTI